MKIVIVTGQTATGKTKLALDLAEKYNGELINCDSRQIYKYLDIITGKDIIDKNFYKETTINNFDIGYYNLKKFYSTRVWLYDIVDPKEYFSSYDYKQCSLFTINKLLQENRTPIIVGGTYFYIRHLLYEVETERIPPNWTLRQELNTKSIYELQTILKNIQVQSFKRLNTGEQNNPQRLIRKIEILMSHKKKQPSTHTASNKLYTIKLSNKLNQKNIDFEIIGLRFQSKEHLRDKIRERIQRRLDHGAIKEVQELLQKGYNEQDPGIKTIGYQQMIKYLKGSVSKEEAIEEWFVKEVQYAKRQYTFMKRDPHISWEVV